MIVSRTGDSVPAYLSLISDEGFELKSNEFENRKAIFDYDLYTPNEPGTNTPVQPWLGVLSFNISISNAASQVNLVVKAGGIELKRYSFTNQPIHAMQEVFYGQGGLKAGRNVIEFEIVDTPMTETGVIKISDAIVYYSTWP